MSFHNTVVYSVTELTMGQWVMGRRPYSTLALPCECVMGMDQYVRLPTAGTFGDDAYRNCHFDLMTVARMPWFLLPVLE